MVISSTVQNLLASSGLALISVGAGITSTQAAQVTFNFAGPVVSMNSGNFVTGSVTFDTEVTPTDIRSKGDEGERLLYASAITDLTFSTGRVTQSFQGGDIQLWNDYQYCTATREEVEGCLNPLIPETDRLFFTSNSSQSRVALIISGNNQDFLASGTLPTQLPLKEDILQVDFFWDRNDDSASIASNNIQLVKHPVPEPSHFGGTIIAATMGWWLIRKRRKLNSPI